MGEDRKRWSGFPFVTAIASSLVFHVILCLGFAEVRGFDFLSRPGTSSLVAALVEEQPDRRAAHDPLRGVTKGSGARGTSLVVPAHRDASVAEDGKSLSPDAPEEVAQPASLTADSPDVEPSKTTDPSRSEPGTTAEETGDGSHGADDPGGISESQPVGEETLQFELSWQGMTVGRMSLVHRRNGEESKIFSRIRSAPVLSLIYRVEGYAESTIRNGLPVAFRERHEAGWRRSDKETFFDHALGRVVFVNHMKGTRSEHVSTGALWDFVSGLYYLRAQSLDVGGKVTFNVFDSNKIFRVDVDVVRREQLDMGQGTMRTLVLRPVVTPQSEKSSKLFEKASDILIWLTDDAAKTPVRIEAMTKIGRMVAILKTEGTEQMTVESESPVHAIISRAGIANEDR